MKTSLKIIALIAAAVYPVGALAEMAGYNLPSSFTPEYVPECEFDLALSGYHADTLV